MIFSPFIKKVSFEFFVRDLVFQYVVTNGKYFMPDGNQSLFVTPSSHKTLIFCPQMGGRFGAVYSSSPKSFFIQFM